MTQVPSQSFADGDGDRDSGWRMAASMSSHSAVRACAERAAGVAQVGASFCCAALWAATEEEAGKRSWLLAAAGQALHMQCTGTLYP